MLGNVGKDFTMTTFLSTTNNKTTAKNFGTTSGATPVIFTVKGKNGKSVEKISNYSSESEFIFKAGTRFKVNSAAKQFDESFGKEIIKISLTEK
jgi:hypothetical protein